MGEEYSYGEERVKAVMIDGELTKMYDTGDEESAMSSITEPQMKPTFWGGKRNTRRQYPSKSGIRGRRQQTTKNGGDDDQSNGSSGSYAMVTPSGGFWVSPMNALGVFSSKNTLPKSSTGEPTPDTIVQDLTQSELELNQMEQDIEGYEAGQQQQQQNQQQQLAKRLEEERALRNAYKINTTSDTAALEDDNNYNSAGAMADRLAKKKKRERLLFYIIGTIIFLGMCALFSVGGYIWWRNKQNASITTVQDP